MIEGVNRANFWRHLRFGWGVSGAASFNYETKGNCTLTDNVSPTSFKCATFEGSFPFRWRSRKLEEIFDNQADESRSLFRECENGIFFNIWVGNNLSNPWQETCWRCNWTFVEVTFFLFLFWQFLDKSLSLSWNYNFVHQAILLIKERTKWRILFRVMLHYLGSEHGTKQSFFWTFLGGI